MNTDWVAGFFDGEGSIFIETTRSRMRLIVSITSTTYGVLKLFSEQYGGSVRVHTVKNRNSKPLFYWRLRDKVAMDFLKQIKDKTHIKNKHIALAEEFCSTADDERKRSIAQTIKTLNHRGKIKATQLPL